MTVAAIARKAGPFTADGSTATYSYGFRILTSAELAVYQDDQLVSDDFYTVTGVGVDTGGTITFHTVPAAGVTIWIFGETIKQQPTSYPENGAFPSASHEAGLDRSMMVLWELDEVQERIPTFAPSTLPGLRNMELPQPVPLQLWSWDAAGTAITYVPATIQTVTPLPGAGARTEAQNTVSLSPSGGEVELVAASIVPAGGVLKALLTHNNQALGNSNGLTGYSVGTRSAIDRFGRNISIGLNGGNNPGQWRNYQEEPASVGLQGVITAEGGPFDATGRIYITAVYDIYTTPTTLS